MKKASAPILCFGTATDAMTRLEELRQSEKKATDQISEAISSIGRLTILRRTIRHEMDLITQQLETAPTSLAAPKENDLSLSEIRDLLTGDLSVLRKSILEWLRLPRSVRGYIKHPQRIQIIVVFYRLLFEQDPEEAERFLSQGKISPHTMYANWSKTLQYATVIKYLRQRACISPSSSSAEAAPRPETDT